jgi:hypothetical protein
MAIDETRNQIISSIWQAVAQSGVDISAIPSERQKILVDKIADTLMVTLDNLLDESVKEEQAQPAAQAVDEHGEVIIWQGRPFLSLVEAYIITTERIKIVRGLISRKIENFELIRIQDLDYKQAVTERMFGIGDIFIRGQDPSNPNIILRNVAHPEEVYEVLRRAWLEARKRYGLQFREFM